MKKFLLGLLIFVLLPFVSNAQVEREVESAVKVYFRQGAVTLDENYMDNKTALREFAKEVQKYYNDSTANFRQIRILSSVSPEGSDAINERIAKRRAEVISEWISREIHADVQYEVVSLGADWQTLTTLVQNREDVPYRNEVLEVLQNVEGKECFDALVKLRNGAPYWWIYKNLFPELRYASARCEFWWETIPQLFISTDTHYCPADGVSGVAVPYTKSVADDVTPVAESDAAWITPLPTTDDEVRFDVAPNTSTEPRSGIVAVKYHDQVYNIPVEQEAAEPVLTITSANPVEFVAEGGNDKITYAKNVDDGILPEASCEESWVESLTVAEDGITYTVAENVVEEPRSATIVVESYNKAHEVVVNQAAAKPECARPFYMSIKTNMLYDLAAVPNIGAEFYLGGNFSVFGNWNYAWWKSDSKAWYWRIYGGDLGLRYWLGKESRLKPLTGHHLGLYGQMITYDIEWGNKGILADRWSWTVGLEYGYSLPIARRLNLDFTFGVGYHWGLFDEYIPLDGHYVWQATKRRQYFGPTKLEVSLVWLIGCGNYNKEKKGRR